MQKKNVVILAGGFGKRMEALYPDIPKPLIPVKGMPILEHALMECKKYGFLDIVLLLHYKKEDIMNYFGDGSKWGMSLSYLFEEVPLGTGGALYKCADYVNESFLIIYADVYSLVNLKKLHDFHCASNNQLTCVVHPNDHPFDSDILETDLCNRILKIHPHPHDKKSWLPNSINAALYCCNKSIFDVKVDKEKFDIAQDLLSFALSKNCKVGAYKTIEYIKDMGTVERLSKVEADIANGIVLARSAKNKKKAIYLDRDGTLNFERGHIADPKDFQLYPKVAESVAKINSSEYLCLCVTNQPVIARGDLSVDGLKSIHNKMETLLGKHGAYLDDVIFCPHHPDRGFEGEVIELKKNCNCRKPSTGMFEHLSKIYNIDSRKSFVIGDRFTDVVAGNNIGSKTIMLHSGATNKQENFAARPYLVLPGLVEAIDFILHIQDKVRQAAEKIQTLLKKDVRLLFLGGDCSKSRFAVSSQLKRNLRYAVIFSCSESNKNELDDGIENAFGFNSLINPIVNGNCSVEDISYLDYIGQIYNFGSVIIPKEAVVICESAEAFKNFGVRELDGIETQSFYIESLFDTNYSSNENKANYNLKKLNSRIKELYDFVIDAHSGISP